MCRVRCGEPVRPNCAQLARRACKGRLAQKKLCPAPSGSGSCGKEASLKRNATNGRIRLASAWVCVICACLLHVHLYMYIVERHRYFPMLSGTLRRRLCTTASRSTTHFGYRTVDETDKERLVGNIFDSVASSYDVMNDLMSAGVHRAWKDSFVHMLGVGAQSSANLQMLDVAGGTGDIAFRIADGLAAHPVSSQSTNVDERARVVVCDINKQMLDEGQRRAERLDPSRTAGWPGMDWVVADAQQLPFDDQSFDVYTIAFGIRNVTRIHEALSEVPPPPQTTDHHHHRPPQTTTPVSVSTRYSSSFPLTTCGWGLGSKLRRVVDIGRQRETTGDGGSLCRGVCLERPNTTRRH